MPSKHVRSTRWLPLAVGVGLCILLAGCKWFRHPSIDPMSFKEFQHHVVDMDTAEAIADPLERCIAYPNPPEFKWSPNLIKQLCTDMWQPLSYLADVKRMIDANDWKGLDRHYDEVLHRHYAGEDSEYILYRSFPVSGWKSEGEADAYTLKWLREAPDSPYANMTRGEQLAMRAWEARGSGFASQVQKEDLDRARSLAGEASALLEKAAAREPKLLPAYEQLISVSMLTGETDRFETALQRALEQSPDTYYVRARLMAALDPVWYGSADAQRWLGDESRPYAKRNPRLLLLQAKAQAADADAYWRRKWNGNALDEFRKGLQAAPDEDLLMYAAGNAYVEKHYAQAIVYWSQVIRFSPYKQTSARLARAAALEKLGDGTRGYCDDLAVLEYDPDNAQARKAALFYEDFFRKNHIDRREACGPGNMNATALRKKLGLH